jgi:hypothetical protein
LDVTMNAAAARLEPAYGRPIMSSLHASYSLAGLFGAGLGGFFAAAGIGPLATFVAAAVPLSILGAVASRWVVTPAAWPHAAGQRNAAEASPADVRPAELLPAETLPAETLPAASAGEASPTAPAVMPAAVPSAAAPGIGAPRSPSSAPSAAPAAAPGAKLAMIIWAFGLLALCEQVGEGSAGDWSAVYLHDSLGTSAGFAAVGLIAFSIAMTVGRLAGDALAARFGPVSLVRCGGLVAAAGLGGGLAFASPVSGIAGFTLLGTGLAVIFPQIIAAAGRLDPARAGRSFARIAGVGYTGLLGGPVVIGFAAGLVGLPAALLIPAVLALVVVALAGTLGAGAVGAGVVRGAAVSAGD